MVSLFVAPTFSGRLLADAKQEDVSAATKRVSALGKVAKVTMDGNKLTEIVISEGSQLTDADFLLFGKLTDLTKLQVLNCRVLNTENIKAISGLTALKSLSITNTVIDDSAVEVIVKSFPNLTELDLSSNANMSNQVMKSISELKGLQTLSLLQNRLDDIGTRRLSKLKDLRVLDLRGNMEAGDMTLGVLAELPKLKALKHRSTAVTDYGLEMLSANGTIENLLLQDFAITDQSGQHLAKLSKLSQLEIFRCQGFGNEGVLALRGLPLQRLTLRDLPVVGDSAMEVFKELPKLKRLYLHELSSVSDEGLKSLSGAKAVELLDIWSVPNMTDATLEVIAKLPNLKELSIRETGITNAGIDKLLTIGGIESLTLKENGAVTEEGLKKLLAKKWKKLDVGSTKPAQE
jgi:Leucine-rich repeat (LRR) protein